MPTTKFAISVPAEVMAEVDCAARERGVTRSRFISRVLSSVARARSDREMQRRINEVFSDPETRKEQRRTAADFRRIQARTGSEW